MVLIEISVICVNVFENTNNTNDQLLKLTISLSLSTADQLYSCISAVYMIQYIIGFRHDQFAFSYFDHLYTIAKYIMMNSVHTRSYTENRLRVIVIHGPVVGL